MEPMKIDLLSPWLSTNVAICEALSKCSSRKDKASAYLGKAGYDIVNLLKSSKSSCLNFN